MVPPDNKSVTPADRVYWADASHYKPGWARRAEQAAAFLPTSGRVADVGCGAPMFLQQFLAPNVEYVPADTVEWSSKVAVVDLDKHQFPQGLFAAVALLGVLEYLVFPARALRASRKATSRLVVSYCHPGPAPNGDFRQKQGWQNAMSKASFQTVLQRTGWRIVQENVFSDDEMTHQVIYHCVACKPMTQPPLGPIAEAVKAANLTYLSRDKLRRLEESVDDVIRNDIPGAFIEFGIALGGSAIIAADRAVRSGRCFVGFDVFDMIPAPTSSRDDTDAHERYRVIKSGRSKGIADGTYYGYRSDLEGDVKRAFETYGPPVDQTKVKLAKGLFKDTWPTHRPGRAAFVHIDCDWHDPVAFALAGADEILSPGGTMLVDDYHDYKGARLAVEAFLAARASYEFFDGPNVLLRKRAE